MIFRKVGVVDRKGDFDIIGGENRLGYDGPSGWEIISGALLE